MENLPIGIQIVVDGQPVRGRIASLTQRSIRVEILHPYDGISKGQSIPVFAMAASIAGGHTYADHAGLTRAGREAAEDLLESLHRSCMYFDTNQKRLGEEFALILKREVSDSQIDSAIFHAARIKFRSRLRAGEMSGPQYQKALAPLAQKHRVFKTIPERAEQRLAEEILLTHGLLIPHGTLEQLIRRFLV